MKRKSWKAESDETVDASVRRTVGQSAASLVPQGAVYVDGKRERNPSRHLRKGQTVMAILEESGRSTLDAPKTAPPLRILYEDQSLLAVDKPAGVNTQPSAGASEESLWEAVSRYLGRPAGLVHRLDRDTSGVIAFGKDKEATSRLAAAFRTGKVSKRYLAVVGPGLPLKGTVELPLSKDPSRPGRYRASFAAQGMPARTDFRRLYDGPYCLVALHPHTGRTHQLRAHLTALGCPILGDRRYGGLMQVGELSARRCLLHAEQLTVMPPAVGAALTLVSPLPPDLQPFFEKAGVGRVDSSGMQ